MKCPTCRAEIPLYPDAPNNADCADELKRLSQRVADLEFAHPEGALLAENASLRNELRAARRLIDAQAETKR